MEFWHVKVVADRLIKREITKTETIVSGIEALLLMFIIFLISFVIGGGRAFSNETVMLISLLIVLWGLPTLLLFRLDRYRSGKHFFERFLNLAGPLLMNMWVCLFGAQFAVYGILRFFNYGEDQAFYLSMPIWLIVYILFFWRLNKWLQYTAQRA